MQLLGLPLNQAVSMLEKEGIPYRIVCYRSPKPYMNTDSTRVLRVKKHEDGYELTVGEFKTEVDEESQG